MVSQNRKIRTTVMYYLCCAPTSPWGVPATPWAQEGPRNNTRDLWHRWWWGPSGSSVREGPGHWERFPPTYLHLNIRCVIRIALCISLSICKANMPRKQKPSIDTQQPKLGPLFVEDFQWTPNTENVNYNNSIYFFKVCFKTHGKICKKSMSDVT